MLGKCSQDYTRKIQEQYENSIWLKELSLYTKSSTVWFQAKKSGFLWKSVYKWTITWSSTELWCLLRYPSRQKMTDEFGELEIYSWAKSQWTLLNINLLDLLGFLWKLHFLCLLSFTDIYQLWLWWPGRGETVKRHLVLSVTILTKQWNSEKWEFPQETHIIKIHSWERFIQFQQLVGTICICMKLKTRQMLSQC